METNREGRLDIHRRAYLEPTAVATLALPKVFPSCITRSIGHAPKGHVVERELALLEVSQVKLDRPVVGVSSLAGKISRKSRY